MYYQPIFSNSRGRFTSAEALLRLEHKELGFIPPDEFIPIAEQTGLINSIGLVVFEKVCRFIASDEFENLKLDNIAVNLSVVQCMQKNLADDLLYLMNKYNVSPTKFKLEITETVAMGSFNIIKETMERLIDLGVKFALDDFGIAYSGVTNMLSLPFSVIKLDKSLIWSMNEDSRHKLTVETIIALINKLNMKAVAEGVELRLEHKELGFIPPDEFIPIAEQTGLINSIGLVVFEKVCRFIASDEFENLKLDNIAVNLSVVQCMQKNLADDLLYLMNKYNVSPTKFKLEITETVAMGSFNIIKETMERLIDLGVKFALDDFGIAYSGVTNMLSLPFSVIKLDKSLIWSMNEDSRHKLTVETIIALINKLNMKAVAEGVETIKCAEDLIAMECEYLQGYYFSKPVPEDVFKNLLKENTFTS
ncbi:Oxygen sensor protein DosP [Clostridioides difficile]|nr:Oxygen sensor protein DosP [Clostridioides difficile]